MSTPLDLLTDILTNLGERHAAYGVEEEHYVLGGQALIATLSNGLGEAFTDEVKAAWVELYGIIHTTMLKGSQSPKGQELLAKYKERNPPKEQPKTGKPAFELVVDSWALIPKDSLADVGALFYKKLFMVDPALSRTLFKTTDRAAQSMKLMQTVDAAVGLIKLHLTNPAGDGKKPIDQLLEILEGLGERHSAYGVEEAHYGPVAIALLATLDEGLGEAFTDEVKAAWVELYGTIKATMLKGSNSPKGQELLAKYKERNPPKEQVKTGKTAFEVVVDSWALIPKEKHDETGMLFYQTLFQFEPSLQRTMFNSVEQAVQSMKLMQTVNAAVGMLSMHNAMSKK